MIESHEQRIYGSACTTCDERHHRSSLPTTHCIHEACVLVLWKPECYPLFMRKCVLSSFLTIFSLRMFLLNACFGSLKNAYFLSNSSHLKKISLPPRHGLMHYVEMIFERVNRSQCQLNPPFSSQFYNPYSPR